MLNKEGVNIVDILTLLEDHKDEVTYVMRTGNIITVFVNDGVKVSKAFSSQAAAARNYTILRRELEGIKVGD